jgi:hypothetical protein
MQIVALHDHVAAISSAERKAWHSFQQAERHFIMVPYDGFFPNPIQRGH